jgi:hypothetical protein
MPGLAVLVVSASITFFEYGVADTGGSEGRIVGMKPGRAFAIFVVSQAVLYMLHLHSRNVKCKTWRNCSNEFCYKIYKPLLNGVR